MKVQPGDHICSVYESEEQLISTASSFLAEGLSRKERCWYVPSAGETAGIRADLERRGIDVAAERRRSALLLLESSDTYIHGGFDPEQTMRVFSDAIEQALSDGFNGFRAAANMSWALRVENGGELLIAYEALLRMLFSSAPATGLCLYDRRTMPLHVVNGALLTHPILAHGGAFSRNAAYDPAVAALSDVDSSSHTPRRAPGHPTKQRRRTAH